jgi:hypothetical protein
MIIQQNYAGKKQKSYKITKMQMFAILDKANPDTGNIRGLNLVAVKHTTVQVTRLLLKQELLMIGHDLLYRACEPGLTEALYECVLFIHIFNNM